MRQLCPLGMSCGKKKKKGPIGAPGRASHTTSHNQMRNHAPESPPRTHPRHSLFTLMLTCWRHLTDDDIITMGWVGTVRVGSKPVIIGLVWSCMTQIVRPDSPLTGRIEKFGSVGPGRPAWWAVFGWHWSGWADLVLASPGGPAWWANFGWD